MVRLTVLFFCIFVAATHAQFSPEDNAIPDSYPFHGATVLRGTYMFRGLGDFDTCPSFPWTDAQSKSRTRRLLVEFTAPFDKTPVVTYSLTRLDMDARHNTRYEISLVAVNPSAFLLEFGVWCNTLCYSARVTFWVSGVTSKSTSENDADALSYVATELSPTASVYK